jgi:flotillin
MLGYRVPPPNEALIISGGKPSGGLPFRIVVGHGAFVLPIFRKGSLLTLALREAIVDEGCVSKQGIALHVSAVIAFKVGSDPASIAAAGQRFLGMHNRMDELTGQIFAGHLRSIVGSMTVEAIIRERQTLAENILTACKVEMGTLGLVVDSLQIKSISDLDSGYIYALSAPQRAAVNQAARIAEAEAARATADAEQESARRQAEYARETAVSRAQYQSEIDQAQQLAAQAGPLSAARAQQAVLEEQAKVAQRNGELREAQLVAEVIKPAQAEAERVRIAATAAAEATRMSAQASAAEGRIALEQAVIAQLPQLVSAAADGLKGANLTILDGAEGLNEAVASIASQGAVVLRAVLGNLGDISGNSAVPGDVVNDGGSNGGNDGGSNGVSGGSRGAASR